MSIDSKSSYYDAGGIEVMEVVKAKLTEEQFEGFILGNVLKYSLRFNFKGVKNRDSEKLATYSSILADLAKGGSEKHLGKIVNPDVDIMALAEELAEGVELDKESTHEETSHGLCDYQSKAQEFAIYPEKESDFPLYPILGLSGEAGEVAEKVKKMIRDFDGEPVSHSQRESIALELGDVLWYLTDIASNMGYTLAEIADKNISKLSSRRERGVIGGNGDNR